jgi:hypothetical protein
VAIFRPDETSGAFQLLMQSNASDKNLEPRDSNHAQPLDVGVLGNVLKKHKPIRVQDPQKRQRHGYLQISADARSCYAIRSCSTKESNGSSIVSRAKYGLLSIPMKRN